MRPPHYLVPGVRPAFPDDLEPGFGGLVALGGELAPEVVLEAYGKGIFPWTGEHPIPWYSPDPRLVLVPERVHVTRRLERTLRSGRFEVCFDSCFPEVMALCADTPRRGQDGTWITPNMEATYGELHHRGFAHSVDVFREGRLVGGLYGLSLGAAFFGESMVTIERDASKVALVTLCRRLAAHGYAFLDCQQVTPHMLRMGATRLGRKEFLRRLRDAVAQPDRWPEA